MMKRSVNQTNRPSEDCGGGGGGGKGHTVRWTMESHFVQGGKGQSTGSVPLSPEQNHRQK